MGHVYAIPKKHLALEINGMNFLIVSDFYLIYGKKWVYQLHALILDLR